MDTSRGEELDDTMPSKSGEHRQSCLTLDLRGETFNSSPLSMTLAVGLSYMAFTRLSYVPFILNSLKTFIMKGCCILSSAKFSASIEMIT